MEKGNGESRSPKIGIQFRENLGLILVGIGGLVFAAISFYLQYFYLPAQQPRSPRS